MPIIPYSSENFPRYFGTRFLGRQDFVCTWAEIIWAAITIGRGDRSSLIKYGQYSYFELLYRTSLIFANLQEEYSGYISRSEAYDNLDPSEKGAVSYFIGLTFGKLFSEKLLDTPWLLHVDLYRRKLNLKFGLKKSKPDLIGLRSNFDWVIIEAKGRTGTITSDVLIKAKDQTRNLRKIAGQYPSLRVAFASYFVSYSAKNLCVDWKDPEDFNLDADDLETSFSEFMTYYYSPFIELFKSRHNELKEENFYHRTYVSLQIPEVDLILGIYPEMLSADFKKDEGLLTAKRMNSYYRELKNIKDNSVFVGSDGILIKLGDSWRAKSKEV